MKTTGRWRHRLRALSAETGEGNTLEQITRKGVGEVTP
jgi:hypothetical protein